MLRSVPRLGAGGPSQHRVARLVRVAEEIAQQLDDPYLLGGVILTQGLVAYFSGQWRRAGELLTAPRSAPHPVHRSDL